jgi:hypothetical protein
MQRTVGYTLVTVIQSCVWSITTTVFFDKIEDWARSTMRLMIQRPLGRLRDLCIRSPWLELALAKLNPEPALDGLDNCVRLGWFYLRDRSPANPQRR